MIKLQCDKCTANTRQHLLCSVAQELAYVGYLRSYSVYEQKYNADGEPIDSLGNVGEELIHIGYVHGYSYRRQSYSRDISVSVPAREDSNSRNAMELVYLPLPCISDGVELQVGFFVEIGKGRPLRVAEIISNADITMKVFFEEG